MIIFVNLHKELANMAITKTHTLTGLNLRKRIRATFSTTPVKELNKLKFEADQILLELEYIDHNETPPLQLVAFYAIVSPWCDRSAELYLLEQALARIDHGQYLKARQALVALAAQDERAPYGVNRTSPRELPSRETTFLGNLELWLLPQSVYRWESERTLLADNRAIIGQPKPTVMEVIDTRASELLDDGINRWTLFLQDLIDS